MLSGGGQLANSTSVFSSSIRRHRPWSPSVIMLHFLHLDGLSPRSPQSNEAAFQRNPKMAGTEKSPEQPGKPQEAEPMPSVWEALGSTSDTTPLRVTPQPITKSNCLRP